MDTTLLPDVEDGSTHKTGHKSARRARLELITRSERRRRWSAEQKLEIVAESLGADTTPTEVARKHSISSGLLCIHPAKTADQLRFRVDGLRVHFLAR